MTDRCPLCECSAFDIILERQNCPVLQNRLYASETEAKQAAIGHLTLVQCRDCAFVFNRSYDAALTSYDAQYQNEQASSGMFRTHLKEIVSLLENQDFKLGKILEIGCGKGYFLNLLSERGHDIYGFDPAYEGENQRIRKEYFGTGSEILPANTILLRHTLEHIGEPFQFLHQIAAANRYVGKIYIEVPCFDWILRNRAFWDIFYEHVNYFTTDTLASMFSHAETGRIFGDQYLYLIADLKCLKDRNISAPIKRSAGSPLLLNAMEHYVQWIKDKTNTMVWGAGAKGVTFVQLIDPERKYITGLIDINQDKQGKYVAISGHKVFSDDILKREIIDNMLIMNGNYYTEIKQQISQKELNLHILGEN